MDEDCNAIPAAVHLLSVNTAPHAARDRGVWGWGTSRFPVISLGAAQPAGGAGGEGVLTGPVTQLPMCLLLLRCVGPGRKSSFLSLQHITTPRWLSPLSTGARF